MCYYSWAFSFSSLLWLHLFQRVLVHNNCDLVDLSSMFFTCLIFYITSSIIINITNQNDTLKAKTRVTVHWHIIITHSPQFTLLFTPGVIYSVGLNKCIKVCIHHYNIIQSYFHCSKNPLCSVYSSLSPFPQPLVTTDLFTVSTVLLSAECHMVEITQYVTFSNCLFFT